MAGDRPHGRARSVGRMLSYQRLPRALQHYMVRASAELLCKTYFLKTKSYINSSTISFILIHNHVLRLQKRIKTLEYNVRCAYCKGEARNKDVKLNAFRKRLEGIVDIDEKQGRGLSLIGGNLHFFW